MNKSRFGEIDFLRAFGILAIIVIHTNAYYLESPLAKFIWNYSQFAVQTFVFCSAYIFFQKEAFKKEFAFFSYFKKRLKRLVLPYYYYLIFFIPLVSLLNPKRVGIDYIVRQVTLTTTNLDLNWFIVLFLYFALLMPFISYLYKNKKLLFYLFCLLSLGSSLFFISNQLPINYKLTMWLPWSLIIIFALYFARFEQKKMFVIWSLFVSCILFLVLRYWLIIGSHSLAFFDNKYPPNFYFLIYGIFLTILLFYLAKLRIFNMHYSRKVVHFLSIHSYSIFFIHFLLIFFLDYLFDLKIFTWWQFFTIILISTIIIQLGLIKVKTVTNYLFSIL